MKKETMDKSKKMKDKKRNSLKPKRILKKIVIAIIGVCLVAGILILTVNIYMINTVSDYILTADEAKDIDADCIIVLGAGVRADGTPTWMLEDRIIVGIDLYKNGVAPKILMSGDHGQASYDEVNTMKQYAIDKEVPSEDIFMDHAGFETYDTMYRAKEIFGAEKVVVVTQKYHLYRAMYIAKKQGLNVYGVSADLREYGKNQTYREIREWIARVKAFGKCILKPTPKYLGEPIDLKTSGDVTNDKK